MSLSIAPSALSAATATTVNAASNTSGTFFHCSADRSSKTSATSGSNPVGDSSGAESRMNLAALLQRDPYITDIVDTAKQVALYLFNPKNSEWERTSIEGTLFVYRRSASPYNGFMILNRLEPNNLIEPITKDLEFQLHDPFLLYRTVNAIYGIWFYDKDDCTRVGQLINSLVQVTIANHQTKSQGFIRSRSASESDTMEECMAGIKNENVPNTTTMFSGPVDIIQLLCKAQYKYNQSLETKKKPEPVSMTDSNMAASSSSLIRPTPVRVLNSAVETEGENYGDMGSTSYNKSPISLETLFRNATVQQNTPDLKAASVLFRNADIQRSNILPEPDTTTSQLPTILKQFGSSVAMVEDIENQPQHHGKCENTTSLSTLILKQSSPSLVTRSSHNGFKVLKSSQNYHEFDKISKKTSSKKTSTVSINKGVNLLDPLSFSSTISTTTSGQIFNFPQSPKIEFENSYSNATDCLHDPSNFEPFPSSQPSYAFHGINHFNSPEKFDFTSSLLPNGLDSSTGSKPMKFPVLAKSCTQELLTPADLESVSLPNSFGSISSTFPQHTNNNLLSPMAFVLQHTKAKSVSSSSSNSPVFTKTISDHHSLTETPSFSRELLQETMINLLKNDSGFLNKIHQAYLLSLKAELSNPRT